MPIPAYSFFYIFPLAPVDFLDFLESLGFLDSLGFLEFLDSLDFLDSLEFLGFLAPLYLNLQHFPA